MRIKIVIVVLLLGAIGIGSLIFLRPSGAGPNPDTNQVNQVTEVEVAETPVQSPRPIVIPPVKAAPAVAIVATNAPSGDELDPAVQAALDRLNELSANNDKESLKGILTELTNPNPIIRRAAIEATTDFRDRAAIPVLKEMAAQTTNPYEKEDLQEAIDYLELPTYTEVLRERKAAKAQNGATAPRTTTRPNTVQK